jgi:hypothetical protein
MAEVGNIKGKMERAWECKEELLSSTCSFLERVFCKCLLCSRNAFSRPFREQGMEHNPILSNTGEACSEETRFSTPSVSFLFRLIGASRRVSSFLFECQSASR